MRQSPSKFCRCKDFKKRHGKGIYLAHQTFNHLLVTSTHYVKRQIIWKCLCVCGTFTWIPSYALRHDLAKSCGCLQNVKHGHAKRNKWSPTFNSFKEMRQRCLNRNKPEYPRYGGRGITICDRWLGSDGFSNFLNDLGERPKGTSLERIDNEGNYTPENCKWATRLEQQKNTCWNKFITIDGICLHVAGWARRTGINDGTLRTRIRKGLTGKDIIA